MEFIQQLLMRIKMDESLTLLISRLGGIVLTLILAYVANLIAKRYIIGALRGIVKRTKTTWDDFLFQRKFFHRFSHLAPALVIFGMAPFVFEGWGRAEVFMRLAAQVYMILVGLLVIDAFLNASMDVYRTYEVSRKIPIRGFVQVVKIILYFTVTIAVISMLIGKDPYRLLAGMGAMTAVLMLIFKDSILGLVAGIQLTVNNMLHIGDWIEMPKYGADGDVIDISLTTVTVQNWDKTISTIPAYALISDSFINWRGMSESGGRRIKRCVHIDMTSVKFCTEEMLAKFKKFQYITDYIETKREELGRYNSDAKVDDSELVNGRRLTNIGTFRAYLVAYLKHHPKIHQNMTFLVRHLEPTAQGLPVQVYVFSNDQVWANFEAIQADIFDHILAVIPEFELRVFQNPTGGDFQSIGLR